MFSTPRDQFVFIWSQGLGLLLKKTKKIPSSSQKPQKIEVNS